MTTPKTTPREIRFETENGEGVAIKDSGEPWHVMAPEGDLQFWGTVREVKARIIEFIGKDVEWKDHKEDTR